MGNFGLSQIKTIFNVSAIKIWTNTSRDMRAKKVLQQRGRRQDGYKEGSENVTLLILGVKWV